MQTSPVIIVGLNPGGTLLNDPILDAHWAPATGSTWVDFAWGGHLPGETSLQRQVRRMAELLQVDLRETFSAQFIPFRSPRWEELDRKEEALLFGRKLWQWVLSESPAHLIVCIGKRVSAPELATIWHAQLERQVPAEWGKVTIDVYRNRETDKMVVGLPHLSTFRMFGRPASERAFLEAIRA